LRHFLLGNRADLGLDKNLDENIGGIHSPRPAKENGSGAGNQDGE
jgi:hypothetical protein